MPAPTITFRAKVQTVYNADDTVAWQFVKVPALTRRHCDMNAFRSHKRFGGYANSDLFPNLLSRQLKALGVGQDVRLDRMPASVAVDTSGFLAEVTITLPAE